MQTALEILRTKVFGWGDAAVAMLPNLVVALVVVAVFWVVSRSVRAAVRRTASKVSGQQNVTRMMASLVGLVVLIAGLFLALGILQLDKTVTSLLAGAGILGLSLGFALQTLATNYIAGTLISVRGTYREGDLIETNGYRGKVEQIDLRVTRLRTPVGEIVLVPNKEVFENELVNHSETGERRVEVDVGVSYDADLDEVRQVALAAVAEVSTRLGDRDVELFFTAFGESSIDVRLRFWIPFRSMKNLHAARSEAITRIKRAFDERGISIPFPIRTLDFEPRAATELRGVPAGSG